MSKERGHIQLDPIFKGCTRPAMLAGVPMGPMILVTGGSFLLGIWGLLLTQSIWPPFLMASIWFSLVYTMRSITRKDDQRFRQIFLRIVLRKANKSKRFWQATAYSPTRYKRRK